MKEFFLNDHNKRTKWVVYEQNEKNAPISLQRQEHQVEKNKVCF